MPSPGTRRWLAAALIAAAPLALIVGCASNNGDWRTASHEPAGLAPDPAVAREAIVQVYSARAWGWRRYFGVHTWIAVKPADAKAYTVYEVIGWQLRWSDSVVSIGTRAPDARWYGALPELLADKRGPEAAALIARIDKAARSYPWAGEYTVWPGPNSNTFTAWVLRDVPELRADLPPTAIGKDYRGGQVFGHAPSGSGGQLSVYGLLGVTASSVEGLEVNLLGLSFGVDPWPPALRLPLAGRVGFSPDVGPSAGTP
ncbi:MAG: DUF3750 domain-containing protein [Burkholderiales bacterium]